MKYDYDFSGYVTKTNIRCSDGRTIMPNAFAHNDGRKVPLMWNHNHSEPEYVLGHVHLEHRADGVYGYGKFNDTETGKNAKLLVENRDIVSMSVVANQLQHAFGTKNVTKGEIREVSLVIAGANPGAFIEDVVVHGEFLEDTVTMYFGDELSHKEPTALEEPTNNMVHKEGEETMAETNKPKTGDDNETVQDVVNSMSEKQKTVMYALIGEALEQSKEDGDTKMKHNAFEEGYILGQQESKASTQLTHSEMETIIKDAKRLGSLKESVLEHGITDIDILFPDAQNVTDTPIFIQRDMSWVTKVMSAVGKSPFSRLKSIFADITEDEARAKGYIKGNMKKDEVFTLLKRTTTPTTVYKKQKLDRDDVVDITDFNVVAWLKVEMRKMLDEELGRALLVGDGRSAASDDKINEMNIRPIWSDEDLFTIKKAVNVAASATREVRANAIIDAAVLARKDYKGTGSPTWYTTEDTLTDCLLMKDTLGHRIYKSVEELATAMRVKEIVTVPVMENQTRTVDSKVRTLAGIIVNLSDYRVGMDKGGAVSLFDDFDIDYNAQKYLIETRCSGALTVPYSAIALELVDDSSAG